MALISERHLHEISGSLCPEYNSMKTHMGVTAIHRGDFCLSEYTSECPHYISDTSQCVSGKHRGSEDGQTFSSLRM